MKTSYKISGTTEFLPSLYGEEIKEMMSTLFGNFTDYVPHFLTEADFDDFYIRGGLDIKTRELLMYGVLITLGAGFQNSKGWIKAGNTKEESVAAMVQCFGYIGFPYAINTIRINKNI